LEKSTSYEAQLYAVYSSLVLTGETAFVKNNCFVVILRKLSSMVRIVEGRPGDVSNGGNVIVGYATGILDI
jgi:hypothetical protein